MSNKYQRLKEEAVPATEVATEQAAPDAVAGPAADERSPFEQLGEQLAAQGVPAGTPPVVLRIDAGNERWVLDLRRGVAPTSIATRLAAGAPAPAADLTVTIPSARDIGALMRGDLSPAVALATRRVRLSGDLRQLRALRAVFDRGGDAKPRADVRVKVVGSRVEDGHGTYRLLVTHHFASWAVWRRWRELRALHTDLSAAYGPSTPFGLGFTLPPLPRSTRTSASPAALSLRPAQIESYLAAILQGLPCRPRTGAGPPALVAFLGGGAAAIPPGGDGEAGLGSAALYSPRRLLPSPPHRPPPLGLGFNRLTQTPGGRSAAGGDGEQPGLSPRVPLGSPVAEARPVSSPHPPSPHPPSPRPLPPEPSSASRGGGGRVSLPATPAWGQTTFPANASPWAEPSAPRAVTERGGVSIDGGKVQEAPNEDGWLRRASHGASSRRSESRFASPQPTARDSTPTALAIQTSSLSTSHKTQLPPRPATPSLATLLIDVRLSQHEDALAQLAAATAHAQTVAALLAILGLSAAINAADAALSHHPSPDDPGYWGAGWTGPSLLRPASPVSVACFVTAAAAAACLLLFLAADCRRRVRRWVARREMWWRSARVIWAFVRVYLLIRRRRYAVGRATRRAKGAGADQAKIGHAEDAGEEAPGVAEVAAQLDADIGSTLRCHIQQLGGLWVKVGQV